MKRQLFCLKKLVVLCAVFWVLTSLAPPAYIRAETSEAEKVEKNMPPEVKAYKVRIRILNSRIYPTISNFALYYALPISDILSQ